MRIWTLHPKYLDSKGLVALWREGLLALAVLSGSTRGYRNHPQLERFRAHINPMTAITSYLKTVADEATLRGYHFDKAKLTVSAETSPIISTTGQIDYEFLHLKAKLAVRAPAILDSLSSVRQPEAHPLFQVVNGGIESWEKLDGEQHGT